MPEIPVGFADVIHPVTNLVSLQRYSVGYGIDLNITTDPSQAVIDALDDEFRARFSAQMDTGFRFEPAEMQVGNDGPPIVVVSTLSPASAGRAGDVAPPNFALLVRKRTAFGGRAFRGRFFFPAMVQDGEVDETGRVATARTAALQTSFFTWHGNLAAGTGQLAPVGAQPMVLLHNPPASGAPTPAPTVVTSLQVQTLGGTQRRRMRR